jgi:hypothetical protein
VATIGSYTVTGFIGRLHSAQQKIAAIETPAGTDGMAVVRAGWTTRPESIRTIVDVTSSNAAIQLDQQYRALSGTTTSVTDSVGVIWSNVTVMGVEVEWFYTPNSGRYRVIAEWLLLPETLRP